MKPLLGFTRYVVLLGVVGNLIAAAILFLVGLLQVAKIGAQMPGYLADPYGLKRLAIEVIQLADYFLIATALYIVSVGLYELFIGEGSFPLTSTGSRSRCQPRDRAPSQGHSPGAGAR